MSLRNLRIILWGCVALAALALGGLLAWDRSRAAAPVEATESALRAEFALTDQTGRARSQAEFRGRWMLVFFGFTHCPDICPTGLATISQVMEELGGEAAAVQPLFLTVDPERDTPAALAEYLPAFHPAIIGLTGGPDAVASAIAAFRVYSERVEDAAAPGGYTMEHSSPILLFDPEGRFVRSFAFTEAPDAIAADLAGRL